MKNVRMKTKKTVTPIAKKYFYNIVVNELLPDLTKRSQEIVKSRFEVNQKRRPKTLESIGQKYGITRERVRQIVNAALGTVRVKHMDGILKKTETDLRFIVEKNHGIIKEEKLIEDVAGDDAEEQGALRLILECCNGLCVIENQKELEKSVALKDFDLEYWQKIKNITRKVLEEQTCAIHEEDLIKSVCVHEDVEKSKLFCFIDVAREINQNAFKKWGLTHWSDVTPKSIREKVYLVLKEENTPMHFTEVAETIDRYLLNKKNKPTHAQTVHNELIKDDRFILIGRGIYALSEWGYTKGTVLDVIASVLKNHNRPLTLDEITEGVLKLRHVKKTTIFINLNDKLFKKIDNNLYTLR